MASAFCSAAGSAIETNGTFASPDSNELMSATLAWRLLLAGGAGAPSCLLQLHNDIPVRSRPRAMKLVQYLASHMRASGA